MAVDEIQFHFNTNAESGPDQDGPDGQQSLLALILALLSVFGKKENGQDFAPVMGFEDADEFSLWKSGITEQRLDTGEAAATLNVKKIDFTAAEKINVPKAMRETGHQILDLIAYNESKGDYNVAFGGKKQNFTGMTINEVLAWQESATANGAKSSAVGRYQIMRGTLTELRDKLHLTGDEKFDAGMQDRLAVALLERRGYSKFLAGTMSEETFMRNLSQEWAALPKDMGGKSFYAGDGLNKVQTDPETVLAALRETRQSHTRLQEFGDNKTTMLALNTAKPAAEPVLTPTLTI